VNKQRDKQTDVMRLKEMFIQVFMESVYPLNSLADLGSFSIAAPQKQVILPSTVYYNCTYYNKGAGVFRAAIVPG